MSSNQRNGTQYWQFNKINQIKRTTKKLQQDSNTRLEHRKLVIIWVHAMCKVPSDYNHALSASQNLFWYQKKFQNVVTIKVGYKHIDILTSKMLFLTKETATTSSLVWWPVIVQYNNGTNKTNLTAHVVFSL